MVSTLSAVDAIYRATNFNGVNGIGLAVRDVQVWGCDETLCICVQLCVDPL